ncbi:hypothetical protein [Planktothrix agardhii]|uniref:hypothetical protein n=1 Tax=Planktothrix agardhii TaxID=1160 RepID=UPI001F2AE88E|nr:hypothetical protein [Planktothrix agardhii]MCF3576870.1 hypothetical protein [Planktothrix agardhii 1812]
MSPSPSVQENQRLEALYGGEEFAIILPKTGVDEAILIAQNIQTQLKFWIQLK